MNAESSGTNLCQTQSDGQATQRIIVYPRIGSRDYVKAGWRFWISPGICDNVVRCAPRLGRERCLLQLERAVNFLWLLLASSSNFLYHADGCKHTMRSYKISTHPWRNITLIWSINSLEEPVKAWRSPCHIRNPENHKCESTLLQFQQAFT